MGGKITGFPVMPHHHEPIATSASVDLNQVEQIRSDPRLGEEIKSLRKIRKMTLSKLAEASGLSTGFLSQIERNQNRPSVTALHRLARALGVSVSWFFFPGSGEGGSTDREIVRADQRRAITYESGLRDELLTPNLSGALEMLRCTFPPGTGIDASYSHNGEEAGIVLSGTLDLWIEERLHYLKAGDSFAFDSRKPHRYRNPGAQETVVIWVITPPGF
jgi:transcriptional regulator with XRE-family HTH domain